MSDQTASEQQEKESDATEIPEVEEQSVSKQYKGKFGKRTIAYTATAATRVMERDKDKKAVFFYVSYTEDDADPSKRPILFAFNGGPGSSTVWLHLGLFGPRRVSLDDDGFRVTTPGGLVDNPESILDRSDIVLVDAIGTGFSTTSPEDKAKDYHHFTKDIEIFSDFIVDYLNQHGRWGSPKYLAGESYGTTRGAAIAHRLFEPHGVELNGLILISSVLNFQTIGLEKDTWVFHPGNDLPFMVYLPSYAATAWYHGKLARKYQNMKLRDLLDEVEEWAIAAYAPALARGDRIDEKERAKVLAKLSDYTGLSKDYIDRYDLRVHILRFCKELTRDQRRTVGRLDSRYVGIDRIIDGDNLENDPSSDEVTGAFTSTLNDYLRRELGFASDAFYLTLSMDVNRAWDYEDFKGRFVDTSENLRDVVSRSKAMRVFVANGFYDLATPSFATDYTLSHLGLVPEIRGNVRTEYYEAGHMMYLHKASLEKMAADLRGFIQESS
jgi:carboxypeptidase C (cathepsin A)